MLQKAVMMGASMIKLMLLHKVELRVSIWTRGTSEQFVMHIQQAISAIRQKSLEEAYKQLLKTKNKCKMKLEEATLHSEFATESQDIPCLTQAEKTVTAAYEKAKAEMTLVLEHRDTHSTHNMSDCHKYKKDDIAKKSLDGTSCMCHIQRRNMHSPMHSSQTSS